MTRKPWVRAKKQAKKEIAKKEEPSDTHSQDDSHSSGSRDENIKEINSNAAAGKMEKPTHNLVHNECIYDSNMLYEQILKLNNPNYAGN